MLFPSISFLYYFLPCTLLVYYIVPFFCKNTVLFIASLIFYFLGEPRYTILLLFSAFLNYAFAIGIERFRAKPRNAKLLLIGAVVLNLLLLGVFKYLDFFLKTFNDLLGTSIPLTHIKLPLGISFFTFQTMSYTLDVYWGRAHVQRNFFTLATYVCLFPQLIAGPIVRYSQVEQELVHRTHSWDQFARGTLRFCIGLGKKVLIADVLSELNDALLSAATPSSLGAWLSALAFFLQIYFDFSGYSDMAIGLGDLFGFQFPENFRYPILSKSTAEFWRRWHMTLGSWFRDYLYIPLGGSRRGLARTGRNLLVVWALTGLWHGAQWNFVVWGLIFAFTIYIERLISAKRLEKIPSFFRWAVTFLIILISFVVFSSDSIAFAWDQILRMFGVGTHLFTVESVYLLRSYAVILAIACIGATPLPAKIGVKFMGRYEKLAQIVQPIYCAVLLILCTVSIVNSTFHPFLYFRF